MTRFTSSEIRVADLLRAAELVPRGDVREIRSPLGTVVVSEISYEPRSGQFIGENLRRSWFEFCEFGCYWECEHR